MDPWIDWLSNNKEWLFSGAALFVLGVLGKLVRWLFKKPQSKPTPVVKTPSGDDPPRLTHTPSLEDARHNLKMHRTKVFISYSHLDKTWLNRLQVHLRPLEREGLVDRWDDTRIKAGAKWREEIKEALSSTKVAVLLVSADFLASDFITDNELPQLLASAEREGATILSVIVSPSLFEQTPLAQFKAVNPADQPLINMGRGDQERVFVNVALDIQKIITPSNLLPKSLPDLVKRRPRMQLRWVFGGLLFVAIFGVFIFMQPSFPEFKYRLLEILGDTRVVLRGCIQDEDENPVSEAQITVDSYEFQAFSSSDGEFAGGLSVSKLGKTVRLRIYHKEYYTRTKDLKLGSKNERVEIYLKKKPAD